MQFLAAGFNAFVLRYSVKPSIFPVALLEAAEAMRRIRTHADEWHCDADAIAAIGFSAGGHLAANLATSASDDVLAAHGYDADAVRPNGLMLAYPVITSAAATACRSAPPKPHGRGSTASNRVCRSGRNLRSRGCVVHLRIPTLPRPALPQPTRLPNNRHSCVFFRVFSRLFCRTTSLFGPKNKSCDI